MFYTFRQNNSGGLYVGYHTVCIEAESEAEAISIAQDMDLMYFDGVSKGYDCKCCGNRWSRFPTDISLYPQLFGSPIEGNEHTIICRKSS